MERVSFGRLFSRIVLGAAALASSACIAEIEPYDCFDPVCPEGGGLGSDSCPVEDDSCQDEGLNKGIVVPQKPTRVSGTSASLSPMKAPAKGRAAMSLR